MAVPSSLLNGAPPRWGLTFSQNWGKFDESVSGSQLHPVLLKKWRVGIWGALLGGLHMWGDALWQVGLCTKTFWLVQSNAGKDWSPLTLLYNRAKNPEVVERVQRGQILSQPGNCPIKVYEVRPTIKCQYSSAAGDEAVLGDGSWGQTRLPADQGTIVKYRSDSWTSDTVNGQWPGKTGLVNIKSWHKKRWKGCAAVAKISFSICSNRGPIFMW